MLLAGSTAAIEDLITKVMKARLNQHGSPSVLQRLHEVAVKAAPFIVTWQENLPGIAETLRQAELDTAATQLLQACEGLIHGLSNESLDIVVSTFQSWREYGGKIEPTCALLPSLKDVFELCHASVRSALESLDAHPACEVQRLFALLKDLQVSRALLDSLQKCSYETRFGSENFRWSGWVLVLGTSFLLLVQRRNDRSNQGLSDVCFQKSLPFQDSCIAGSLRLRVCVRLGQSPCAGGDRRSRRDCKAAEILW